jgi:hypothetical protein
VSSTSSISSLSSTSIYSNPGSLMMHQQLESLQPHGHNLLLQNTNASNLFNHNQFNKQIGMNNKLSINPNLLNTTSLTANNTNSNSSFASFQSKIFINLSFFFIEIIIRNLDISMLLI